jgi:PilZ domain-containing protein
MAPPYTDRRRSKRLNVLTPAVLQGKDASAREFFDRAEIVSFDQRGARVKTRFLLVPGSEVEVKLASEAHPKRLRVIWRGDPDTPFAGEVGLELVDPSDNWSPDTLRAQWEAREF